MYSMRRIIVWLTHDLQCKHKEWKYRSNVIYGQNPLYSNKKNLDSEFMFCFVPFFVKVRLYVRNFYEFSRRPCNTFKGTDL